MTIAKDERRKATVSPAKLLAAAIKKDGVTKNGYTEVPVADINPDIKIVRSPSGNIYPQWLPKGANPKGAIRMKDVAKIKAFRDVLDEYLEVAEFIAEVDRDTNASTLATASKPSKPSSGLKLR